MFKDMNNIRYFFFCILHFFIYQLQFAKDQKEREEFMEKYHKNDPFYS